MTKKKILPIAIFIIVSAFIIGAVLHIFDSPTTSYYEYADYENFEDFRSDFDIACDYFSKLDAGTYYLLRSDGNVSVMSTDGNNLSMTDVQTSCLQRIQDNCFINGIQRPFSYVIVNDRYVWFKHDAVGCGLMYTDESIRHIIKELDQNSINSDERYGYINYKKGWYGIYR